MHEIKFKLAPLRNRIDEVQDNQTAARARFERGLDELRLIKNKKQYEEALRSGVRVSIKGFRERCKIGNTSMRETNGDLFVVLQALIKDIDQKFSDKPGKKAGRPPGSKQAEEVKLLKARIAELERLLEARTADTIKYLSKIQKISIKKTDS